MLHVQKVLCSETLQRVTELVARSTWIDGRSTAGHLSATVKKNRQIPENDANGLEASGIILSQLAKHSTFASAALACKISPPLFNVYETGEEYGPHIDGSIRPFGATSMRTDLSATLFLSDPESYDGGELVIKDATGEHAVKLPAGDILLYSATSVHFVSPVIRGARLASFFWVQSLIRDPQCRTILFDLDRLIQSLSATESSTADVLQLTSIYHNLLRLWSEI